MDNSDTAVPVVELRPVTEADLALLDEWQHDPIHRSEYGDFLVMYREADKQREHWNTDGLLGEDSGELIVTADGEPVGDVQWRTVEYGPNNGSRQLDIGITLASSARGKGIGSVAQRMLADFLFNHTTVHRVEASTDITNLAEQNALSKAGFTREGVLRGAQFRCGAWHDLVIYSRLRTD
ncbi:MAG: GNAT family N-acetyltransferase [Acidothermaceae bacterium]